MPRREIFRLARNEDGSRISELLQGMGFQVCGIDWSCCVENNWIVAENQDGKIIGNIQIILGQPIGWLELMAVDQGLLHHQKARVVKGLLEQGILMLSAFNCQAVMGVVPDELESYRGILDRFLGAVDTGHGIVMAKRLV